MGVGGGQSPSAPTWGQHGQGAAGRERPHTWPYRKQVKVLPLSTHRNYLSVIRPRARHVNVGAALPVPPIASATPPHSHILQQRCSTAAKLDPKRPRPPSLLPARVQMLSFRGFLPPAVLKPCDKARGAHRGWGAMGCIPTRLLTEFRTRDNSSNAGNAQQSQAAPTPTRGWGDIEAERVVTKRPVPKRKGKKKTEELLAGTDCITTSERLCSDRQKK